MSVTGKIVLLIHQAKMKKLMRNKQGSTFIELVLYIGIFLIISPILFSVALNALRASRTYDLEKQTNNDAQFITERVYDLITGAKKIDLTNSNLNTNQGKLVIVNQDNEEIIIDIDNFWNFSGKEKSK